MCRSAPTGVRTKRHQLVWMRKQILCHLRSASAKTAASPEGPGANTEITAHSSLQDSDGSAEPRTRPRMGLFHMCAGLARLGWTWQAALHGRDLDFHQNRATCLKVSLSGETLIKALKVQFVCWLFHRVSPSQLVADETRPCCVISKSWLYKVRWLGHNPGGLQWFWLLYWKWSSQSWPTARQIRSSPGLSPRLKPSVRVSILRVRLAGRFKHCPLWICGAAVRTGGGPVWEEWWI